MASQPEPPTVSSSAREIFLRVLDTVDPDDRATLVDSACGENDAVRSEVESLLEESSEVGDFLQSPAVCSNREPPKISLPSLEAPISESSGDHIGPFELLEPLGEGGCGTVYAAEQSSPVRRTVALKIIKLGMDTRSVIARFESERQALAMMDHPNIAKVFDAGATDTGRPYFVMELVRGVPITEFCDQQKLSTKRRLKLFILVCNAIQHAHQKGIIHRDIKPTNILIGDHDGTPAPKVIDFGIAKATDQRLTDHTLFTSVEAFIGTPTYMSPEQAEISGTDVDTRSDIYSLGVLLYELLVGQPPFDAAKLQSLPLDEVRRTIREVEPERPSQKLNSLHETEIERIAETHDTEPAKLSSLLRGDLDWIVVKCLEKERSRRYATASDLVADLERHLSAQPVLARPPSTLYRLKKLMHRHGAPIAAGALLFVTLLAGIGISMTQAVRAKRAEIEAQLGKAAQVDLRRQADLARDIAQSNAAAARLNEYVADINLTQIALSEGNFGRARQLIEKHRPATGEIDNRSFEWHYLSKLSLGDAHQALENQGSAVQCLAYSPDGQTLAIGLRDEVRLWDLRQRRRIPSLPGGATSLLFLPDSQTLVSSDRNTTWVVDTSTWLEVKELRNNWGPLALSADGSLLASTGNDGIHIWDTTDWFEIIRLPQASRGPRAFSPDGKFLAAPGPQGITLWSLADGRATTLLDDSADLFDATSEATLGFSADGSQIIAPRNTSSARGVFVLSTWDAGTGAETGVLPNAPGHTGAIGNLNLHPRSNLLATASLDHSVGLWDLTKNAAIAQLSGHRSGVLCVALSPDGRTVASGSQDGDIFLWPTSTPPSHDTIDRHLVPLTFSQDSRRLAAAGADSVLTIFQLPELAAERSLPSSPAAAMSADLKTLVHARGGAGGEIEIVDTGTLESRSVSAAAGRIDFLAIAPDGKTLLSHARREPMRWWNLQGPEEPIDTLDATSASFSADGATLAAFGGADDRVEIREVASGRLLNTLTIPQSFGFSAALSPDGSQLATTAGFSDSDNLVSLWDTASGELIGTCAGHKESVRSVTFTPDGKTLATASSDSSLKLWNVATQQELLSIRRLGTSLGNLLFSPDGQWLVGSSSPNSPDGELRFFHAPTGP